MQITNDKLRKKVEKEEGTWKSAKSSFNIRPQVFAYHNTNLLKFPFLQIDR